MGFDQSDWADLSDFVLKGGETPLPRVDRYVMVMATEIDQRKEARTAAKAAELKRTKRAARVNNAIVGAAAGSFLGGQVHGGASGYKGARVGALVGGLYGALSNPKRRAEIEKLQTASFSTLASKILNLSAKRVFAGTSKKSVGHGMKKISAGPAEITYAKVNDTIRVLRADSNGNKYGAGKLFRRLKKVSDRTGLPINTGFTSDDAKKLAPKLGFEKTVSIWDVPLAKRENLRFTHPRLNQKIKQESRGDFVYRPIKKKAMKTEFSTPASRVIDFMTYREAALVPVLAAGMGAAGGAAIAKKGKRKEGAKRGAGAVMGAGLGLVGGVFGNDKIGSRSGKLPLAGALAGGYLGSKLMKKKEKNFSSMTDRAEKRDQLRTGAALAAGAAGTGAGVYGALAARKVAKQAAAFTPKAVVSEAGQQAAAAVKGRVKKVAKEYFPTFTKAGKKVAEVMKRKVRLTPARKMFFFNNGEQLKDVYRRTYADPLKVAAGMQKGYFKQDTEGRPIKVDVPVMHAQVVNAAVRKAGKVSKWAGRAGGVAKDASAVVRGKPREKDASGRSKKREWEKSWFKEGARRVAIAGGILGGAKILKSNPRLRRKVVKGVKAVKREVNKVVPDMYGFSERYDTPASRLFAAKFRLANRGDILWKSSAATIKPDDFLKKAQPFGKNGPHLPAVENYRKMIREGKKIDMPSLHVERGRKSVGEHPGNFKVTGHEGRHRMIAAKMEGVKKVPVEIFAYGEPRHPKRSKSLKLALKKPAYFQPEKGFSTPASSMYQFEDGGKRFKKVVKNEETGRTKTVRYGQAGKASDGKDRIRPGTAKGDAYCARSAKIKGDWQSDPNSPNNLSRRKWKCVGSVSKRSFSTPAARVYQFDDNAYDAGWDVRDPRGRSARVFAPGARKRDRREKRWHEKAENERKLWKTAVVTAGIAGLAGGRMIKKGKVKVPAKAAVPSSAAVPQAAPGGSYYRTGAGRAPRPMKPGLNKVDRN